MTEETPAPSPPVQTTFAPRLTLDSPMRTVGWLTLIIGGSLTIWGLGFDPTVSVERPAQSFGYGLTLPGFSEDVVNIGEAVKKLMIFTGGVGTTVAGLVMICAAEARLAVADLAAELRKRDGGGVAS